MDAESGVRVPGTRSVSVYVRIRDIGPTDQGDPVWQVDNDGVSVKGRDPTRKLTFDAALGPTSKNQELYHQVRIPLP